MLKKSNVVQTESCPHLKNREWLLYSTTTLSTGDYCRCDISAYLSYALSHMIQAVNVPRSEWGPQLAMKGNRPSREYGSILSSLSPKPAVCLRRCRQSEDVCADCNASSLNVGFLIESVYWLEIKFCFIQKWVEWLLNCSLISFISSDTTYTFTFDSSYLHMLLGDIK